MSKNISVSRHVNVYEPVYFEHAMMIDVTKLFILILCGLNHHSRSQGCKKAKSLALFLIWSSQLIRMEFAVDTCWADEHHSISSDQYLSERTLLWCHCLKKQKSKQQPRKITVSVHSHIYRPILSNLACWYSHWTQHFDTRINVACLHWRSVFWEVKDFSTHFLTNFCHIGWHFNYGLCVVVAINFTLTCLLTPTDTQVRTHTHTHTE